MSPYVLLARVAADADGLPRIPWSPVPTGSGPPLSQGRYHAPGPLPLEAGTAEHFDGLGPDAPWPPDASTYVVEDLVLDEHAAGLGTGPVPPVLRPAQGEVVVAFSVGRGAGGAGDPLRARPGASGPGGSGRPPIVQGDAEAGEQPGTSGGYGRPEGSAYAAAPWQRAACRALQRATWARAAALVPAVRADEATPAEQGSSATWDEASLLLRNAVESGVAYGRSRLVRAVGPWGAFAGRSPSAASGSDDEGDGDVPHVRYELAFFHEASEAGDVQFLVEHVRSHCSPPFLGRPSFVGGGAFPPPMGDGHRR